MSETPIAAAELLEGLAQLRELRARVEDLEGRRGPSLREQYLAWRETARAKETQFDQRREQ